MMEQRDLEAMRRAIEVLRSDPELRDQIETMLRNQSEQEVGTFAVGFLQVRNLRLKGWECPPCDTFNVAQPSDHYGCRANEVTLLRRMLAAGLSRFDPNPMPTLERIERERAA
jgi:hypothetical protein